MRMRFFVAAAFLLSSTPSFAEWNPGELPLNPAMNAWFNTLHSKAGDYCCDTADGSPATTWGTEGTGYTVTVYGKTFHVDDAQIVPSANRIGEPIVWTYPLGSHNPTGVRCFLPGSLG
jgi:hypothetical protein